MWTSSHQAAVTEAERFLEAGERVLGHDLVFGDDAEIREGAAYMITMAERARRFLEIAQCVA